MKWQALPHDRNKIVLRLEDKTWAENSPMPMEKQPS
jgi:hypothetical protein